MNTAKAGFYQGIANGQPAQTPAPQGQGTPMPAGGVIGSGGAAPIPAGGGEPVNPTDLLTPAQKVGLAVIDPAASQALTSQQKAQQESPAGKGAETTAVDIADNINEAQKNVATIDARIPNAMKILDDQISLAPNTFVGKDTGRIGERLSGDIAGLGGAADPTLASQTKFEQNNAALFNQELPAIMGALNSGRIDIPLVDAIKEASAIDEYGTPEQKVMAAQNLKGLLLKAQENAHGYLAKIGDQPTATGGRNASQPNAPAQPTNAKEHFDSITAARQAVAKGAPVDAVRKRLMDAGIDPSKAGL